MNALGDRVPLEPLDPGASDPGFWVRFHARVMDQAVAELARRQAQAEIGIAEVVFAWRRTLVPLALMAAALAGILLVSQEEPPASFSPIALEEALTQDLVLEPIPSVLGRGEAMDELAFLTGGF